ncbi:MAG: aminopeptidase [Clostridia bacterium]|nr:aminopeptidase [Clostridia bacterium]
MIILGITGPTGSGKSEVADVFRRFGFRVIDADSAARKVMEKGSDCLKKAAEAFGGDIIDKNGELKRALLAQRAFSDKESNGLLNSITHPAIMRLIKQQLDENIKSGCGRNIIDAPLLFEAHGENLCTDTLCVIAGKKTRADRIMRRDGLSFEKAMERINAQKPDEYYTQKCSHIILNDGCIRALREKAVSLALKLITEDMSMDEKKISAANELKERLFYQRKHAGLVLPDEDIAAAYDFAEGYKEFLNCAKTEREAVKAVKAMAEKRGYTEFEQGKKYNAGDRVYYVNRGKAIILTVFGKRSVSEGLNICAAHIDSPRLDLKPNPLYEDNEFAFFKTHYYGGIKKYQWTAMPLSLHGTIVRRDGTSVDIILGEDENDPVFCVTDLLPHLAQEQMKRTLSEGIKAEELNILIGSMPFRDDEASELVKLNIMKLLFEKYGITEEDFLSAELEYVPCHKAKDIGFDRSMVGSYGQDDRVCAYTALMATLDCKSPEYTAVTVLTDKEETGSDGNTGLNSSYLKYFISDLADCQGARLYDVLTKSHCLSADVNVGFDPNFPDVVEKRNVAYLNQGIVVTKYTGARGKAGTSDASAEYVGRIRRLFDANQIRWQTGELGRTDLGGGGTVAMYIANMNVDVVDVGVPVLGMHSPFEVTAKLDVYMAYKAFGSFIESVR